MLAHAGLTPWAWQAHPDVWLLIAVLAGGWWVAVQRFGPALARPGEPVATSTHAACWYLGVALTWAASDWPMHGVSSGWLFSVHMVQHMVFMLVAPPLLLLGMPPWMLRAVLVRPPVIRWLVTRLGRPLPAAALFNTFIVLFHWPALVDYSLRHDWFHFLLHAGIFGSALLMWLPVVNRLPELPRLRTPPARMGYLFLQTVVPTVPASFITFADAPVYHFYEKAPRWFGIGVVEDQQIAGAIMKLGGLSLLGGVIIVMFFRWYDAEQKKGDVLLWEDVEAELTA